MRADEPIDTLIDRGEFTAAERRLRAAIPDAAAPVTGDAAVRLEIIRRTRRDFSLTAEEALEQVRESLPDAAAEDLRRWTESGVLQHRVIDGQTRYFRRAPGNLFRLDEEARRRREAAGNAPEDRSEVFDHVAHVRRLVALGEASDEPFFYPVRHRVRYELAVGANEPRIKPGARVAVWLPFPQEYGQQSDVRLISSDPPPKLIAPSGSPHRTVYFEKRIGGDGAAPRFAVEYEFVTRAVYRDLDPGAVESYRQDEPLYRRYTAPRPPHIVFTPEVVSLVDEIVGDETNPLLKARAVFRWVSENVPWVGEMEYGVIPSLSAKGLAARCGDCGVQGMTFITLCRAAGVPARWQSGFGTRPGRENLHDWSEIYVEPWGWLPVDASYGVLDDPDPRVRDFHCGGMDPYRLIVNLDYARPLAPPKTSFRSEPNDFQRGEVEVDGHNLYFDAWRYDFEVTTEPPAE